jgi:hypothetical protein
LSVTVSAAEQTSLDLIPANAAVSPAEFPAVDPVQVASCGMAATKRGASVIQQENLGRQIAHFLYY